MCHTLIYSFLVTLGLCCCTQAFFSCSERGYSSLCCTGFLLLRMGFLWLQCVVSLWQLLLLQNVGSRCTGFSICDSGSLEHGFYSCGPWAPLSHGMWNLPGPRIESVSPSLASRFLTTGPLGTSPPGLLKPQDS